LTVEAEDEQSDIEPATAKYRSEAKPAFETRAAGAMQRGQRALIL